MKCSYAHRMFFRTLWRAQAQWDLLCQEALNSISSSPASIKHTSSEREFSQQRFKHVVHLRNVGKRDTKCLFNLEKLGPMSLRISLIQATGCCLFVPLCGILPFSYNAVQWQLVYWEHIGLPLTKDQNGLAFVKSTLNKDPKRMIWVFGCGSSSVQHKLFFLKTIKWKMLPQQAVEFIYQNISGQRMFSASGIAAIRGRDVNCRSH